MSDVKSWQAQQARNKALLDDSQYMRDKVESEVLPLQLDFAKNDSISDDQALALQALEIEAARISVGALASLATINELDHLGGGLDLISALLMTMTATDYEKVEYTIENAHTSIGYYSSLAALGFLDRQRVIETFRRGIDIPGHVSWVPGGTQLNGGRLGVMIPVAVGQALGIKSRHGEGSWVVCHCGDAGWISGQALNGFNGADLHSAPITFVMHRNGIQLSDSNKNVLDKDPRPMIASQGIEIVETSSLHDVKALYKAYHEAYQLAQKGRPSLVYPAGFKSEGGDKVTLKTLSEMYGIAADVEKIAGDNNVSLDTEIWIPGSLMSYRDVVPMLECVFLANDLPGGKDHHDGHMKGRDEAEVLSHSMFQASDEQKQALEKLSAAPKRKVVTEARPAPGSKNLVLSADALAGVELPDVGKSTSARAGVEKAYELVAKTYPDDVFVVSCDLNPSTKLGKAVAHLKRENQYEMSIEEQVSALMADGLAMSSKKPQLNVVSTFAAFYEGIAREALELWRYQRNLNGVNEGLNVVMHLSHVGACTGRDHFSGWSLDWITLSLGYLPYVDRIYTPADARSAFVAIRDSAARYGAHIVNIPRDNLPILAGADGKALWNPDSEWEAATPLVSNDGAKRVVMAVGSTAFLAEEAAKKLTEAGTPTDAIVVNGFPFADDYLANTFSKYSDGVVTVEDGIIGTDNIGLRGFAGMVSSASRASGTKTGHVGIIDPRIAPAEGHMEVWEHFGLTTDAVVNAVNSL